MERRQQQHNQEQPAFIEQVGQSGQSGQDEQSVEIWDMAPAELRPFLQWGVTQSFAVRLQVLACFEVLVGVQDGQYEVQLGFDLSVSNVWAMMACLDMLREMAQAAGFVEAVAFLQAKRQEYMQRAAEIAQVMEEMSLATQVNQMMEEAGVSGVSAFVQIVEGDL